MHLNNNNHDLYFHCKRMNYLMNYDTIVAVAVLVRNLQINAKRSILE